MKKSNMTETYNAILLSLIAELNITEQASFFQGWDIVQTWPTEVMDSLLKVGLLELAADAKSLECQGCERRCFSDVIVSKNAHAFIVCEEPAMQNTMGRIIIPGERLKQWKASMKQFARVIAGLLAFDKNGIQETHENNFLLGMSRGKHGRRWISLVAKPLSLEINNCFVPVEDVLFFEEGRLTLDKLSIDELANNASRRLGKTYTPSTDKREEQKMETVVRHQDWQDAYLVLRAEKPNRTKTYYAKEIAKKAIAQGRDFETIRRIIK
ncbi:MAG: hypothetical protein A2X77_02620 [Gammaproteobacteria bacterium GWE2_42_36]|nr:MAG: hypothetical protein A2X77_02620 [Gammaproteobacteria bacterium GWE2_42_36]HCU05526.1 hypothetical protein [Coxiellaceae bacterium]